jgi:hypothetical protein
MGFQVLVCVLLLLQASCSDQVMPDAMVRVDTTLAKETAAEFDDEKEEAFLAAFSIVSNLNPGDTETIEIRRVTKATPSIGLVITIEIGCNAGQIADVRQKLAQKGLDASLASFMREPPGGVEIGPPRIFSNGRFLGLRKLEKSDYLIVLVFSLIFLLLYKKNQNDVARRNLLERKQRRRTNKGGDGTFQYTQDPQLSRKSHSAATENFDDLEMQIGSWR